MTLGTQLKHYRVGLGWSLEQLSQRSGVDIGTISALETRKSSRSKFAPDLARALRLSLDQFLDERYDFLPQLKMGVVPGPIGSHSGGEVSNWPFEDITPEQWHRLEDNERGRIEAYARGFLDAKRAARKNLPPRLGKQSTFARAPASEPESLGGGQGSEVLFKCE